MQLIRNNQDFLVDDAGKQIDIIAYCITARKKRAMPTTTLEERLGLSNGNIRHFEKQGRSLNTALGILMELGYSVEILPPTQTKIARTVGKKAATAARKILGDHDDGRQ